MALIAPPIRAANALAVSGAREMIPRRRDADTACAFATAGKVLRADPSLGRPYAAVCAR